MLLGQGQRKAPCTANWQRCHASKGARGSAAVQDTHEHSFNVQERKWDFSF